MRWFFVFVLCGLLPSCSERADIVAEPLRLRVTPEAVFLGDRQLASGADALADWLAATVADEMPRPDVRLEFAKSVRGERMVDLFNAVIGGGYYHGALLHFSIEGNDGGVFQLTLPDMCCDGRNFEPFCDDWGEGGVAIHQGQRFIELDVVLRDGVLTAGGEVLDPDEFLTMLIQRRRQADGIMAQISIGSEDTAGQLLPLLQACQFMEAAINIGAQQRETNEREQRRLARLLRTPRRNPIFDCGRGGRVWFIPNASARMPTIEWFPTTAAMGR